MSNDSAERKIETRDFVLARWSAQRGVKQIAAVAFASH